MVSRVVLGDYVKEIYPNIELQINLVHWWNEELELWEQTYRLVIHWQEKEKFNKVVNHTVSLFHSVDKEVVVKMFELSQGRIDLNTIIKLKENK